MILSPKRTGDLSIVKIEDLAGLSQPLTRLIEVIARGVGAVYGPYLIRKTADARAYEIKTIANALNDVSKEASLPVVYEAGVVEMWQKPEDGTLALSKKVIEERSESRRDFQERKRQENIEKITSVAAAELANESSVPSEKPDEDWVTRFFSEAEDVSTQEMQELWGRILAGEIIKPGSYSLRTLQFVKNISKSDAQLFEKVGRYALQSGEVACIAMNEKAWLNEARKIIPNDHFVLAELGLLFPSDLGMELFRDESKTQISLQSDEHVLIIGRGKISSPVTLPIWKFTAIGRELLPLVPKPLDTEYYERLGRFFVASGGEARIGKIKAKSGDQITYEVISEITMPEKGN